MPSQIRRGCLASALYGGVSLKAIAVNVPDNVSFQSHPCTDLGVAFQRLKGPMRKMGTNFSGRAVDTGQGVLG